MELTNDILFKDGVDRIDVRKKLKGDFSKAGDLSSIIKFDNESSEIASMLFALLPLVMQDKLLSGAEGSLCRFTIRAIGRSTELGNSICSEMQHSDKFPVFVADVSSIVCPSVTTSEGNLDHVRNQEASFASFKLDSPTEMLVDLNLVADDHEPMDSKPDVALQTRPIVQCSESPDVVGGMDLSSGTVPERITSQLEAIIGCPHAGEMSEPSLCLDIMEERVCLERRSIAAPEQVANEPEELSFNLDSVENGISSCKAEMPKPRKPVEPLQHLKIAPRNVAATDSFRIESVCDLRPSLSVEEQETSSNAKGKVGEDGNFEQPQPPGTPPAITGFRIVKYLESKKDMKLIQCMANHLGQGGFGSVFKAQDQDTGTLMAIKRVKFMKEDPYEVMKEVHIMNGISHHNIISVLGSQIQDNECQIFLEWMAGGSVQELLNQYGPMSATVIQSYSTQVLSGVAYLHQYDILHCDIKGANIVVDSTGLVAKLCDFGLALKMPVPYGAKEQGTIPFMAPELFNGSCNSPESDVWSMGCTMIQMATGKQPWDEFHHYNEFCVILKICKEDLPIPSALPLLLQKAISDCLQRDVLKRPTARDLQYRLAMPFLENTSASPCLQDY